MTRSSFWYYPKGDCAHIGLSIFRKRVYDSLIDHHLKNYRQVAFVGGPRQVGKTTSCRMASSAYLNWDNTENQRTILQGTEAIARLLELDLARSTPPVAVFDELHKFPKWKGTLKGLFDAYADRCKFIVTGSSRLDVYRHDGDSLMGRYFLYRMHPFSVAECADTSLPTKPLRPPAAIDQADRDALWQHGGFPEPFLTREESFTRRWASLRLQQLSKEDIREATQVQQHMLRYRFPALWADHPVLPATRIQTGIYVTPPTTTSSVFGVGRIISQKLAGAGAPVSRRDRLPGVPNRAALATGSGVSELPASSRRRDPARAVAVCCMP